jgi:hypothetical protein
MAQPPTESPPAKRHNEPQCENASQVAAFLLSPLFDRARSGRERRSCRDTDFLSRCIVEDSASFSPLPQTIPRGRDGPLPYRQDERQHNQRGQQHVCDKRKRRLQWMVVAKMLTTKEAAAFLGRPHSTLERWRCEGRGPDYVKEEGGVRYHEDHLRQYIRRNTRTSSVRALVES